MKIPAHCASDPLPRSFVGSSYKWTALNLDSERLSQVPYDEQATPAHLGLDQQKTPHPALSLKWLVVGLFVRLCWCPPEGWIAHW